MDIRRKLAQRAHHLEVVAERQVGVLAADDVDLADAALRQRLARLVDDLVDRQRIGVGVAFVVTECAEEAAVAADVGVVDVAVADEVDLVADVAGAGEIGHGADREDVGRFEQDARLGLVQAASGGDGLPDPVQPGARGEGGDVTGVQGCDSRRISCSGPQRERRPR